MAKFKDSNAASDSATVVQDGAPDVAPLFFDLATLHGPAGLGQ